MTEADSIIRDPNVAVEFARQIFLPKVQQLMVGRSDYEVFQEVVHGAVKRLYTSYEIGMRLRATRREIEQKEGRIRSLEARAEKAENELRKANTSEAQSASQVNPIVTERVNWRIVDHTIADRQMASMFAIEAAKNMSYEKGFHDGWRIGIDKTKEKLADEVCRCENRGFKHGWIKALQAVGVDSASPLYQKYTLPFEAFDAEKTNDEDRAE